MTKFIIEQINIELNLQHQRALMLKIEVFLAEEAIALESELKAKMTRMSYTEKDDFMEYERLRIQQAEHTFPQLQRSSSLISLYSTLENSLNFLCKKGSGENNGGILLTDLVNNNLIERSKIYLLKVLKLNFPLESSSWEEIKKIQQIRNAIVHNGSIVKSGNSQLIGYINQSNYIELVASKILLKKGFLEHACTVVESFFYEFFEANKI